MYTFMPRQLRPFFISIRWIAVLGLTLFCAGATAQVNSWTSTTGGNWQDPNWSLGILPGNGQFIMLTNGGSKTLTIGPTTAQNLPQTLDVYSVTLSSPPGVTNTLLLDGAGLATPLKLVNFYATNADIKVIGSALRSSNEFRVAGTLNQGGFAAIIGKEMDFGFLGPGTYNLTNGAVTLDQMYLGGGYTGRVNQVGGTNTMNILQLGANGEYDLHGGKFSGTIYGYGGVFRQDGGLFVSVNFGLNWGAYYLAGGVFSGSMVYPDAGGFGSTVVQTGGTNLASPFVAGIDDNAGYYTLSNGLLQTTGSTVQGRGGFTQAGGTHIVNGHLNVHGGLIKWPGQNIPVYAMSGGFLSCTSLTANFALFDQTGGTNQISGTLSAYPSMSGFDQFGMTGYALSGGLLTVSNIDLEGGYFLISGGTLVQSGVFTFAGGRWRPGVSQPQLGAVKLSEPYLYQHYSAIHMPGGPCVLQFANSSSQVWADGTPLMIEFWNGSPSGGGIHRVLFGNSSAGLTDTQVAKIRFEDPAGFTNGAYSAKILATGEVVPDPTRPLPPMITAIPVVTANEVDLVWQPGSGNETSFQIERKAAADPDFTLIASVPGNTTSFADMTVLGNTLYTYRMRALGPGGYSDYSEAESVITPPGGSLPPPWQHADIGNVGASGNASYSGGIFSVTGSGTYIYNTNDSFHFVYRPWSGDGQIVACVVTLDNSNPWAQAGVMFRQSIDSGSPEAMIQVTPQEGIWFLHRDALTNETSVVQGPNFAAPHWLKLVRLGNSFAGYESADGANWSLVASATIAMPANILVGLAVSSHTNGILATATFDNVTIVSTSEPRPILQNPVRLPDGSMQLTLPGQIGRAYRLETSFDLFNWTTFSTQTNSEGTIVWIDPAATNYPQRFYRAALLP